MATVLASVSVADAQPKKKARPVSSIPDVPAKLPVKFAVMPFVNNSGVQGLNWMSAGVALMVGEKASIRGMRGAFGVMIVPRLSPARARAKSVAEFGRARGAKYVWTGWVKRPDWDLQMAIRLWRIDGEKAVSIGEEVNRGDFKDVHNFTAASILALYDKANILVVESDKKHIERTPTTDFYAFTLFGRGLSALLGTNGPVDLQKAAKDLQRSVFIDPKFTEAQRVVGEFYRSSGKTLKARARMEYALSLRPDYYPAIVTLARINLDMRKYERSRELYEAALRLRPSDLESRYRLGSILWETGHADEAFRELSRVLKHKPDDVRARRIRALVHASRGDGADLVSELEEVAKLAPKDTITLLDLGAAYAAVDRHADAIKAYEAVIAVDGKHLQALKFLGDLYKRKGDVKNAIKYYSRALKSNPNDPRPYFLLGAVYILDGKDKKARGIYRRAQKFKKYLPEVYNNLGAIAFREGKQEAALWYHRRAVLKKPNRARYRYNYALSLSAASATKRALEQIELGLALDPEHTELTYLRGVVLLRKGDAEEAREAFEATLAIDSEHTGAQHNISLLDEMKRRLEQGEIVIEGK